ncbi:FAD/NAD(P)-binding domain-containing protein [Aspergillus heteromorphus CBS 117.55]|uniref:FAD/NAD(P)-binding domain-containing protein n=1 Tax=Aspergillus heteromorphus CBS 117.55 TaxID=1448321 RepID=A0A317X5K6_9EURO|nr:FAD/NAD(P)-binding domain-containing protein [Aspergillus heteromorphus CBS 117.55]PWY92218.1 FAD/NAD(P)-binding domain-containing protein [Aspergillus heteromorphus CBS 117.55]
MARIKSVAIIGAGASGAITASALAAEKSFDRIRVFERRETAGGTWIYDADPGPPFQLHPGKIPPEVDPPISIPRTLPVATDPVTRERFDRTPIYEDLTTNVPDIAMSYSDLPFAYGPFVPHWVPKQYIEEYFSKHEVDRYLVLNTTVEDVSRRDPDAESGWSLTLRRLNPVTRRDEWWAEDFDALVIANGHYSVPYIPQVPGLQESPHRIMHSKQFRSAGDFTNKKVLIIGNSSSGQDLTTSLLHSAALPIYQSRRSRGRWDGDTPPPGVVWKPIITRYLPSGDIIFSDGSMLSSSDIDTVIYCTGYKPSFPFWNTARNGGHPLYDYAQDRLLGTYLHTFFQRFADLAIVGLPRVLTFRSMEYQAIAVARLWAGRNAVGLPSTEEQARWEANRVELTRQERRKFHDIPWDNGETMEYLRGLFELAGLPRLEGQGRCPPVLDERTRWAIANLKKYPEPEGEEDGICSLSADGNSVMIHCAEDEMTI